MIKKFLLILLLSFCFLQTFSQCAGTITYNVSPAGPYVAGDVVTFCYQMNGWNLFGNNWLEGFRITLGPGWTGLTPVGGPPGNCNQSAGGTWLWFPTVTVFPAHTIGPGWFFEGPLGGPPNDGNPTNDYGDYGTNCTWSFCFTATVRQSCTPQSLSVGVAAGGDGTWGSWTTNACPTTPLIIYSGVSTPTPVITSPIYH